MTGVKLLPLPDRDRRIATHPAGEFSSWLAQIQQTAQHNVAIDVPCGSCNACCRSSYFIRVNVSETDTIASIPEALLFPAPGEPGVMVMGFNEQGHCPMLVDDRCSIYSNRPQTCRTYDCRLFAGCGTTEDTSRPDVVDAVSHWQFTYAGEDARVQHRALITAADFLHTHRRQLPQLTDNPLHLALAALKCQHLFSGVDEVQDILPQVQRLLSGED